MMYGQQRHASACKNIIFFLIIIIVFYAVMLHWVQQESPHLSEIERYHQVNQALESMETALQEKAAQYLSQLLQVLYHQSTLGYLALAFLISGLPSVNRDFRRKTDNSLYLRLKRLMISKYHMTKYKGVQMIFPNS